MTQNAEVIGRPALVGRSANIFQARRFSRFDTAIGTAHERLWDLLPVLAYSGLLNLSITLMHIPQALHVLHLGKDAIPSFAILPPPECARRFKILNTS